MLAKPHTFSLLGIDALPVDVSIAWLPETTLVGLPEAAVRESTHRVERAMVNSRFQGPHDQVVTNLAAELPKQAASFDLPIALGVLVGSGQVMSERFRHCAVVGKLSLEGRTRPAKGALSMAMSAAHQRGLREIVVADTNAAEAAVVEPLSIADSQRTDVIGASHQGKRDAAHLRGDSHACIEYNVHVVLVTDWRVPYEQFAALL